MRPGLSLKPALHQLGAVLLLTVVAACGDEPKGLTPPAPGTLTTALLAAPRPPTDLPVVAAAREELLQRAPSALPATQPSGTLIGTDTGLAGSAAPRAEPDELAISLLPTYQASSAGSERDLRAALYFELTNACKDEAKKVLPPESVLVEFRIDSKGQIDRASVRTKANNPAHENAARCMARRIRATEARFTPPRLEKPIQVSALVPSVD